jgi:hypothetical protein
MSGVHTKSGIDFFILLYHKLYAIDNMHFRQIETKITSFTRWLSFLIYFILVIWCSVLPRRLPEVSFIFTFLLLDKQALMDNERNCD